MSDRVDSRMYDRMDARMYGEHAPEWFKVGQKVWHKGTVCHIVDVIPGPLAELCCGKGADGRLYYMWNALLPVGESAPCGCGCVFPGAKLPKSWMRVLIEALMFWKRGL